MKTILLIEDNEMIRDNTTEILELSNYHVLSADNGKTGLEMAVKKHPDLIICDIMMPEMNGLEVLKNKLNTKLINEIPFIFLTARADELIKIDDKNTGPIEYITKPYKGEDLLRIVAKYLPD